jgi:hypothetical protein
MRSSSPFVVISCLALAATPAIAGTWRDDRTDSQHQVYSTNYPSVGMILTDGFNLGSGTLVAPNWVLTAAHVVGIVKDSEGNIVQEAPTGMNFTWGENGLFSILDGNAIAADDWFPHPGWTGDITDGFDIGLIHLPDPVSSSVMQPVRRYHGTADKGVTGNIAGYGASGMGSTGYTTVDFYHRAGQNMLDLYGGEDAGILAEFGGNAAIANQFLLADMDDPGAGGVNRMGSSEAVNLEYSAAPGDSGGGILFDHDGVGATPQVLVGVTSFLSGPDGTDDGSYGDIFGASRVTLFNDWISSHITVPGDADADFDVDFDDLALLGANYGIAAGGHWHLGDFDLDGDVDLVDLTLLATNYGPGQAQALADFQALSNVPEPAGVVFVTLAIMTSVTSRRRR